MKKIEITAKMGSKEKGNFKEIKGEAKEYTSTAEAIKDVKEERVLSLINRQTKTDAMDALRKSGRPKATPAIARLVGKLPAEGKSQVEAILKKYGIAA